MVDTDYQDNNCSSWHFEKATNILNIDLLMFLKPLSNLLPSTRSCPLTKSFWSMTNGLHESPALIPDLLDELPCLWSPLSQGWAQLSWNFKFVCYILCAFHSIEASGFFPLLIKDCSKLFWQNSLSSHFFYKNIAKVSLRVSENSYSQKQCSQHHSVSFLQIFTKGFE